VLVVEVEVEVEQTLLQQQPFAVTVGITVAEHVEEVDENLEVIREANSFLVLALALALALVLVHLQSAEDHLLVSSLLLILTHYYSY
jgi:hypothetical protein